MKQLSKREIKELNNYLQRYNINIDKKDRVYEQDDVVFVNDKPLLLKKESNFYPTLFCSCDLPNVYVDKGAIPFVTKGADLMRPGIVDFEEFEKGAVVAIKDNVYKKTLALGIAIFSSEDIKNMDKGKVIKTYNFIGDKIWKLVKSQ